MPKRPIFPNGHYYSVLWTLPEEYGGMTNAVLQRSRAFADVVGVPVDILTFQVLDNIVDLRRMLCSRNLLGEGVRLRNMWEEILSTDPSLLSTGPRPESAEVLTASCRPGVRDLVHGDLVVRRVVSEGGDAKVVHTDYLRPDGTVGVTDQLDWFDGNRPRRRVTILDHEGDPVVHLKGKWALYRFWLDFILSASGNFIIVDSKAIAPMMSSYSRDNVYKIHLLHGSHLRDPQGPPDGALTRTRAPVLDVVEKYDAVVTLTPQQAEDLRARGGPWTNLDVVPNSRTLPRRRSRLLPPRGRGVVVAGHVVNKRVDLAIRSVQQAHALWPAVSLDIYGTGPETGKLMDLVRELGAAHYVRFMGHVPDVSTKFAYYDFLLLTSRSEGQGLVILEAMGGGCVPFAFNIRYGPSDIISDGVDGFLVRDGDELALARRLLEFLALSDGKRRSMRRAAWRRAQDYSDASVVRKWGRIFWRIYAKREGRNTDGWRRLTFGSRLSVRQSLAQRSAVRRLRD